MFKIESYVAPILLSYVDKYVRDFKPADAQLSLWGGGVALHNLVLKADVLQQELALPFTLVSGRIHELLIQVPWTKIVSEPIVVTIDTIECVLSLNPPAPPDGNAPQEASSSRKTQEEEAPPGYMQALVRRVVSNIRLRVHHLIVKYVQDDIVMSLNVKHLAVDSAGTKWEPAFADIEQSNPVIRRLVRLDDLTLCLDKADADGKIRFYQEPLLYRCQLDLKVLTRLVSANSRRISSMSVQLRSTKLAWSVTNEQVLLLLRLIQESPIKKVNMPPPKKIPPQFDTLQLPSSATSETNRSESWSEWAWSFLPAWNEPGVVEEPATPAPLPIYFNAYLDEVSLVFKVMEVELARKRARGVLELVFKYMAVKGSMCSPTMLRVQLGIRDVTMLSNGKCVCGYVDYDTAHSGGTAVYLKRILSEQTVTEWQWPEDVNNIDIQQEVDEANDNVATEPESESKVKLEEEKVDIKKTDEANTSEASNPKKEPPDWWDEMSPVVFMDYTHDRSPPDRLTNPYENPPRDFEYSDWVEVCSLKVKIEPMQFSVCMGLLHRLGALYAPFTEQVEIIAELPKRTLTVEEWDALLGNLPQRRIHVGFRQLLLRILPYEHRNSQKLVPVSAVLDTHLSKISVDIIRPLYPYRVCSAACQMPDNTGKVCEHAQMHVTTTVEGAKVSISSLTNGESRPCARADIQFVYHKLLHPELRIEEIDCNLCSYFLTFKELNICGSLARLQVAVNIPFSLLKQRACPTLKHTTLFDDALNDEGAVAIDITLEELHGRYHVTPNVSSVLISIQSARAMAFHGPQGGTLKQAWLFSAPETPSSRPYCRMVAQYCVIPTEHSIDYLGMWSEGTAASLDPLLISWLAYKPAIKSTGGESSVLTTASIKSNASLGASYVRRTSSSGRKTGSGSELVHMRSRSQASSSEPSERKTSRVVPTPEKPKQECWWEGERLQALHDRLRGLLLNIELGKFILYVTTTSPSALDCATIIDSMERHAENNPVVVMNLGRLQINSQVSKRHIWQELRCNAPTFFATPPNMESFPWKLHLADISCYTLELPPKPYTELRGITSRLRPKYPTPQIVLELVTTNVTLSVVTKNIQYKTLAMQPPPQPSEPVAEVSHTVQPKAKFFSLGMDFKPTSLKDFVRGPKTGAHSESPVPGPKSESPVYTSKSPDVEEYVYKPGPRISVGVHIHADTSPIIITLQKTQLHLITSALHGMQHLFTLLYRKTYSAPKANLRSPRSLIRSVSEMEITQRHSSEDTDDHASGSLPDMNMIFDRSEPQPPKLRTYFCVQWVLSYVSLVVSSNSVKLASKIDDIICTIDMQPHYNQIKVKVSSAYVKYYEMKDEEWVPGPLGGRVLEAREPTNTKEDNNFFTVTVTQAEITELPSSWKEELHPKVLEQIEVIWEVYVKLAPLEAVLHPQVIKSIAKFNSEIAMNAFCSLETKNTPSAAATVWPFFYLTGGGLRLLVTGKDHKNDGSDDTFVFTMGKVNVNPHPENPICRRSITAENNWSTPESGYEGRQYEAIFKTISLHSANLNDLIQEENGDAYLPGTTGENPAFKWSQKDSYAISSSLTPILHPVDVCCVYAPPLVTGQSLKCGPAFEFNLASDCFIEFSPELITLMLNMAQELNASTSVIDFYKIRRRMAGDTDDLVCAYPSIVMKNESKELDQPCDEQATSPAQAAFDVGCSNMCDSGVETIGSASSIKTELPKKKVSVSFIQDIDDPSDYLEVFVTMGVVELSLYVADSDDPQVVALRPHDSVKPETIQKPKAQAKYEVTRSPSKEEHLSSNERTSYVSASRSLAENVRDADMAAIKLETIPAQARRFEGNIPLVHVSLCQPNLYYSRRKIQQTLQLSLFNIWVGLGLGPQDPRWHQVLLTTAKGEVDLHTDIPPALATMKLTVPYSNSKYLGSSTSVSPRGSLQLDVERPVQAQVCAERLKRIKAIASLLTKRITTATYRPVASTSTETDDPSPTTPMLYNFRRRLLSEGIETVTIILGQISLYGAEGTVGWESATIAISTGQRPDRITVRCLVTSLVIGAGPEGSERHILLMPVTMGGIVQARWEAWRRAEGGPYALEPSVRVCLDLDSVVFDIRPADMAAAYRMRDTVLQLLEEGKDDKDIPPSTSTSSTSTRIGPQSSDQPGDFDYSDNYYKDDLRSGAFKLETGDQIPMAYQVVMGDSMIAWRYPHPRTITRVIAFPLPEQEKEIECVLELYSATLNTWSPHTYFCIPVGEPCELQLEGEPPETVFCSTWRFRVCAESEPRHQQFVFSINQFRPIPNPTGREFEDATRKPACHVPAEQLLGALRVDSFFAPRLYPPRRVTVRVSEFDVYLQNSICNVTSDTAVLEGYYVTKTTQRSHRVLCLSARNSCLHLNYGTPAGMLFVADTNLSVDILDSATGAMEQMFHEFRVQATVACGDEPRTRLISTGIHIGLNLCRLHTLHSLWTDWKRTSQQISVHQELNSETKMVSEVGVPLSEVTQKVSSLLEGRISLWIHNNCTVSLRVGQEGTDEIVTLAPGSRLAYRWRSPTAAKKLRLGMASPSQEWIWSAGIPFVPGSCRMRLGDAQLLSKNAPGSGVFMHVKIEQIGTKRFMYLVGRLVVANMLRYNLFYKVRDNMPETQSTTVCSEELRPESVGKSVLCSSESDMLLRIKLADYDIGWSGDIPLKECPKEHVPWLVKVPSDGDAPFISVWCRVSRARTDGRILACFWPLYLLYSYLPLDTDALIRTVAGELDPEPLPNLPPLVQTTPGRGSSTQFFPPGTTHARHTISLRYRNVDCPVTPDVIPFHYGVTESSVFDRRVTINDIEDVIKQLYEWLNRSRRDAPNDWPYSVVTKHWPGQWEAAVLQPRSDVIVQYGPVIAGGGCSLELRLCPAVLLCNAAPIPLTLRAHDAAPLCKLEPGHATSPPKIILTNTFYISIEIGRETFVSSELQVSEVEPGRYGAAPAGHIILEHPTEFSVMCHQKVALLSMYYEINDEINILGVTTTYVLINRLKTDILVAPITYYQDSEDDALLKPKAYDVIHPSGSESSTGTPVCQFWLHGRWRSDDASQLRSYLCLALPDGDLPAHQPVPVQLGDTVRRAVALIDANGTSVPVVVSQMRHEGRKVVVVASDPCPQFLVHNHTMLPLYVAQPVDCVDNSSTSNTLGMTECSGARWWCYVPAGRAVHYSTPSHCARYPPPPVPSTVQSVPFLTFAKDKEIGDPIWCPPVAAADGEQLLQLHNVTIKMRVRTHPHSTLIELQDFDTDDISASDIRRRLLGSFKNQEESPTNLERTKAENELFAEDDDYDSPLIEEDTEEPRAAKVNWPSEQALPSVDKKQPEESTMLLYDSGASIEEKFSHNYTNRVSEKSSYLFDDVHADLDKPDQDWAGERARCIVAGVVIEMAARADTLPLIAVHLDRTSVLMLSDKKSIKMLFSVADVQVDNLQYESGQFDFSVVASTRSEPLQQDRWPPLWNMFYERDTFATRQEDAKLLLKLQYDKWRVVGNKYTELTEVELRVGTLALFIEDAYVTALVEMSRIAMPSGSQTEPSVVEERMLQNPLRLRKLLIHPLDLTLTLHTAVRMYIALDQSPLRLSAFELQDMMTSSERLTHALTMHYLSAAILGAGWVVGGLELLGAPGALAARVGGATGGVRGVASAAAAALLRSLSAWAGSLARNLDILAGDEEHAQRAAAARRRPPPSFVAGLVAGITNFAINMLGAVGGLAHHPLVGVAVGETESGAAALRRGIIGALTKPLSATADLVAYAGTGLLRQTGWDPVLQPRRPSLTIEKRTRNRWRRDCVRWMFRLSELNAVAGFEVLADNVAFHMLLTHKCIILADRDTERILKMIDYRYCSLGAYQGQIIELRLTPRNIRSKVTEIKTDDDEGYFVSAAAMARVARYTSAQGADMGEGRVIHLLPAPYRSHELYAILLAVLHNYHESHFTLL